MTQAPQPSVKFEKRDDEFDLHRLAVVVLLTALVAERISVRLARWLLWPLVGLGAVSVFHWQWTEAQGSGDLRPYFIVLFGSLLVVVLLLAFYQSRYTGAIYLLIGLSAYVAAKLLELADQPIWSIGHIGCVAYILRVRAALARATRRRETPP